jgi:uncharacterized SAM-binding protein YcdF (DUF218 family)
MSLRMRGRADPAMTPADAIVVLGAALRPSGEPGFALVRRLEHGVRVLERGRAPWLVLSGGVVGAAPSEAQVMADLARARGVDAGRLILEERSRNTFENALHTGRIMRARGWARVVVVTDPFHMPRALYVFRRLGLEAAGDAVEGRGGEDRLGWYGAWLREPAAFVKCAWLFRIGRHKPLVAAVWGT